MPVDYMCGPTDVTMQLLNELSGVMKELPDGIKMCYIKTLTNAWATSSRYHESKIHRCLFGCACALDNKDLVSLRLSVPHRKDTQKTPSVYLRPLPPLKRTV